MPEELEMTRSERVLIWRRRSQLSQEEAAQQHGVSHRRWGQWERGVQEPEVDKNVGQLALFETLFLTRRRAGVSQSEVAADLGCTRAWVQAMETGQGSCVDLARYWEGKQIAR